MATWCRVRSLRTGHHFDVTLQRLAVLVARGAVEEILGRRHTGAVRPPKPRRPKGVGVPRRRKQ